MRAAACSLLLLALSACAPWGRIHTPRGSDRLRSAWSLATLWSGVSTRVLFLSTSTVPCGPPDTQDPDAITAADMELAQAWTREGSQILVFALFSDHTSGWSGSYPVVEVVSPVALDVTEPHAALAAYHAVWEAEVSEEDGLYREYAIVEEQLRLPVPDPGTLTWEESGDIASGTFALDSLDVSGDFQAEACPEGEDSLLASYLLAALLNDWVRPDTDEVYP